MSSIFDNKILVITMVVWAIAQGIKVFVGVLREKKFNFKWFIGTGGMPSSHAAGATALAVSCGMQEGFGSVIFALAAVFAMVTMFDAQGVRRASGKQAAKINPPPIDIMDIGAKCTHFHTFTCFTSLTHRESRG